MTRAWFMTRVPSDGPVLGASVPRAQMAPSSRCGRNSDPMIPLVIRNADAASAAAAVPSVTQRNRMAHPFEKYVVYTGLWHIWGMFAPAPLNIHYDIRAEVKYRDGSSQSVVVNARTCRRSASPTR